MARSCGIHIDQRRFHVVALDGGAKRHKVLAVASGEIPFDEDPVHAVSDTLRKLVKKEKLNPDGVGLAVDSGMASFRTLSVPFDDRAKIEDIIKFEIESDLPQWDIDDVIIDFLVLDTKPGVESKLLVTGIPKPRLERQLAACERGGLEAQSAELDGTALFEAAGASGRLSADTAQVLVHVGDSSTVVVVADGLRLHSMRSIRAGAMPRYEPVPPALPEEDVEGVDAETDQADEEVARRRLEQTAERIQRELARTIAGVTTEHPIEGIWFCGHTLAGLAADVQIADLPLRPLNAGPEQGALGEGEHDELLAIAYGAALRGLGVGLLKPDLRREELRFTGKFERLELPLAVFALLLCTLLGVKLIVTEKRIGWKDEGNVATGQFGDMQYWLHYSNTYLLPDPKNEGYPGRLKNPPKELAKYLARAESGEDDTRTKYQEIVYIRGELEKELKRLKTDMGQISDYAQPQSALQATTLVLGTLDGMKERVGRFSIRGLDAKFVQGSGTTKSKDRVELRIDMDFFAPTGGEANQHHAEFMREMRGKSWCLAYEEVTSKPFPDGGGLSFDRILIEVDVSVWLKEKELEERS